MNKTKEQIRLMVENAIKTAEEEHFVKIENQELERIAGELLFENIDRFLRSVFGTFTLADTLHFISVVEERKLEARKKPIASLETKTKAAAPARSKAKTEAH